MIDYLDLAQNFIDSDRSVPNEILQHLNFKEQQIVTNIGKIKNRVKTEIDRSLPDKTLNIVKQSDSSKKRYKFDLKILYAAAALLAVVIYFPISQSIETKTLLKEETARFVNQLFLEDGDEETYILADLGITVDWFDSSIIQDFR